MISKLLLSVTSDGVLEGVVQVKDYLLEQVGEIFVIGTTHVAYPLVSVH
jgi:hypothetical protein